MFLMWGGLVLGLALTVLSGRNGEDARVPAAPTVPTIRVVPSTVSAGETVPLRITVPSSTGDWTYGYTATLQQLVGEDWKFRYTLLLGMDHSEFSEPQATKDRAPLVMAIGFGGDGVARIKVPQLESGRYRIGMEFGYNRQKREPRHIAYADLEVH